MSGVLNLLLAGAASAIKDAYFNLTTLLLNTSSTNGAQNNTFLDSSTNNFTITRNGNTTQGTFTPFSQTGWGNYFNGSSWISVPDSTDLDLASGTSWTMEAWVFNTASGVTRTILGSQNSAGDLNFVLDINSSNKVSVRWTNSTPTNYAVTDTSDFPLNQWVHVAGVNNGGTMSLYVDGVSKGTPVSISGTFRNLSSVVSVGRGGDYAGQYFTGFISNARIVNGTAIYTGAYTPSTTPLTDVTNTKLLTCQSNRFIDTNTQVSAKTVTVGGTPSVQAFSPFAPTAAYSTSVVGGSGYFDGSGDYLSAASNAAFAFGTGDFTIEFWYYPAVINLTNNPFIDNRNAGGNTTGYFVKVGDGAGGGATTIYAIFGGSTFSASGLVGNAWNHVAVTRSGTTVRVYVNGVSGTSGTSSQNLSDTSMLISKFVDSASGINGYISSLRLVKGTAVYTGATLTIPTAPLTAISGTSLLLSGTNAGIYDSTAKNALETVGNAQVSTTQAKWGTTSMYFDGTGDWLLAPSSPNVGFGTGNFTVEMWVYPTSNPANGPGTVLDARNSGTSEGWVVRIFADLSVGFYDGPGNVYQQTAASALSLNTWTYLAFVRSGTTLTIYVNGTSAKTATVSSNLGASWPLYIGNNYSAGYTYYGYIDDLRITKGYARTISASPTAAFALQ
jgi:hypothetical protein